MLPKFSLKKTEITEKLPCNMRGGGYIVLFSSDWKKFNKKNPIHLAFLSKEQMHPIHV